MRPVTLIADNGQDRLPRFVYNPRNELQTNSLMVALCVHPMAALRQTNSLRATSVTTDQRV